MRSKDLDTGRPSPVGDPRLANNLVQQQAMRTAAHLLAARHQLRRGPRSTPSQQRRDTADTAGRERSQGAALPPAHVQGAAGPAVSNDGLTSSPSQSGGSPRASESDAAAAERNEPAQGEQDAGAEPPQASGYYRTDPQQ